MFQPPPMNPLIKWGEVERITWSCSVSLGRADRVVIWEKGGAERIISSSLVRWKSSLGHVVWGGVEQTFGLSGVRCERFLYQVG